MVDWGLKITPGNRENSIIISIRECLQICSGILGTGLESVYSGIKFLMVDWGLKITPGNRENSIIISIRECLQICSGIIGWW